MIDASTKLCALIGHPVEHSVSPQMHNAAFRALGLNYVYLAFDVSVGGLEAAVRGLGALGARGFNVTIPHKVAVLGFLDEVDGSVEETGAVNTVVVEDGKLIGYNTDVYGVVEALREVGRHPAGRALVLGAGGAARAVVSALSRLGYRELVVANRSRRRGEELAGMARSMGFEVEVVGLSEAGNAARESALIVNATPLGMYPEVGSTPLTREEVAEGSVVLDLVYNPVETRLLREAAAAGARTVSGLDVLVAQGAEAFKLWTGVEAPVEVMREAAARALEGLRG